MYKINKRSITLRFDNCGETENKIKAICMLLGGYNKYGREINTQNFEIAKREFENAIFQMEYLLNKNGEKKQ